MATADDRPLGARALSAGLAELKLPSRAVAARAGVDANTVRSLLDGSRWPNHKSRGRLEEALDWPAGEIERRALDTTAAPDFVLPGDQVVVTLPTKTPTAVELLYEAELIEEFARRLGTARGTVQGSKPTASEAFDDAVPPVPADVTAAEDHP